MTLSMQSFCPTTARKLKTVHTDFDVESHYFHLKTQTSQEDSGELIVTVNVFLLVLVLKYRQETSSYDVFFTAAICPQ